MICIVFMIALGSLGVSYAKWSTVLYMNGTMVTATTSVTETFNPSQDSYIDSATATTNYGTLTYLLDSRSGSAYPQRALVYFNLTTLSGKYIDSATLRLYANSANKTVDLNSYHITNSWTQGGVTWNSRNGTNDWTTPGGDYTTPAVISTSVGTAGGWVEWNVTNDVITFANGTITNYGWLLRMNTGMGLITFSSKEGANLPQLVVTYHQ